MSQQTETTAHALPGSVRSPSLWCPPDPNYCIDGSSLITRRPSTELGSTSAAASHRVSPAGQMPNCIPQLPISVIIRPRPTVFRSPQHHSYGGVSHCNLKLLRRGSHDVAVTPLKTRCALVNARSICNKTFILQDSFTSNSLEILFITEIWMSVGDSSAFTELVPSDCSCLNSPRTTGRGGGTATIFKNNSVNLYHPLLSPPLNWACLSYAEPTHYYVL